jgi:hypothetical protein
MFDFPSYRKFLSFCIPIFYNKTLSKTFIYGIFSIYAFGQYENKIFNQNGSSFYPDGAESNFPMKRY